MKRRAEPGFGMRKVQVTHRMSGGFRYGDVVVVVHLRLKQDDRRVRLYVCVSNKDIIPIDEMNLKLRA